MNPNLKAQRLVAQINKLYHSAHLFVDRGVWDQYLCKYDVSRPILYDMIYDQLIADSHKIDYEASVKNELWKLSQEAFMICEYRAPTENDTELLHRYYKSFLAKKYLLEKLPYIMHIKDEVTGKHITEITLKLT